MFFEHVVWYADHRQTTAGSHFLQQLQTTATEAHQVTSTGLTGDQAQASQAM